MSSVSGVRCHMSDYYFFNKVVGLVIGGSVINGPSRLVSIICDILLIKIFLQTYISV